MNDQAKSEGRRRFLKTGVTGLAGAAVLPSLLHSETKKKKKFISRTLGKTGIKLPIVSMGVMNATNPQLVRAALEAGILFLDTAHYYSRGRNERMIAEVIKDVPRDSYVIATKARPNTVDRGHAPEGANVKNETVDSFIEKVNLSLKRLGLDYVDILYYHSAKSKANVFDEVPIEAMQKLKKQGKIKHMGITTHSNEAEVIRAAVESKVYEVVLTAYSFRMKNLADVQKAIAEASKAGLGVVAMKTQAGVYWDRERTKPINMKAALKWALQNKHIHTSIPGFTAFDQLETDISVMEDLTLTAQERKDLRLDEAPALAGLYCQQCQSCLAQCGKNLEIPDLMRSYMYVYGYKNPALAKETLHPLNLDNLPCHSCSSCKVNCTMGFDVKQKILDIARIKTVPGEFLV
jgi:aryl-alcohol dehydrogenase-like predicted oxidoreductase